MKKSSASVALLVSLGVGFWSSGALAQVAHIDEDEVVAAPREQEKDRAQETTRSDDGDTRAFRVGAIAGFGFPRPLQIEGMIKLGRWVGLGAEYSAMPSANFFGVQTDFWGAAGDARLFLGRSGFFIGARGGFQHLQLVATGTAMGVTATESAVAETAFVNPRIGWLYTWKSGFTLGIDAGVQVPISPKLVTSYPQGVVSQVDSTVTTVANMLGNNVTPTIDLVRIGFLL